MAEGKTLALGEMAHFSKEGTSIDISSVGSSRILVMSGAPLDEPIASSGPFVMNTQAELQQAFLDFRTGKMGKGA